MILENWNISRVKLENLIKSTQWFKFSKMKIIDYKISNIELTNENENNYCLIRINDENLFTKHELKEFSIKQSIWGWMKLRWITKQFDIVENKQKIIFWSKEISLEKIKNFSRTNKWINYWETFKIKIEENEEAN